MSIPSITLRLDFGENKTPNIFGGVSMHSEAPGPDMKMTTATVQDLAPTPMLDIGGINGSMNQLPIPDLNITAVSPGTQDLAPQPMLSLDDMNPVMNESMTPVLEPESESKTVKAKKSTGKH